MHATLVDTALRVFDRFVHPLTDGEAQAYHVESGQVAVRLGVPVSLLPPTIDELRGWMRTQIDDGAVRVTPQAREVARTILYPHPALPRTAAHLAHLVSISTLPPALRRQYGIGWSSRREAGVDRLAALSRRVLPALPSVLRFAPQARAARRRAGQVAASKR